jgi:3-hydroxyacyl-CoA dehydrogenase
MHCFTLPPTPDEKSRALQNVRQLVERNRGQASDDAGPGIRSVGIIGAGMMGRAIAAAHLKHDLPVVITDVDEAALLAAPERVAAELAQDVPPAAAENAVASRLRPTRDLDDVARCDLVLETIVENVRAKWTLYAELEGRLADGALLVSNTSTIPIAQLGEKLNRPKRFCGFHFFHPVRERPLVEVIRGERTSEQTLSAAAAHARALGRMPLVVSDGPAFLVNRLLTPWLAEAMELLDEGASVEAIDEAALRLGMAKGPCALMDEIGLDVSLHGAMALGAAFEERIPRSLLLVNMIKAGRLGRKSGKGFYAYGEAGGRLERCEPDEELRRLVARWAGEPREHTPGSIAGRLVLPMLLEATRALDDGIIADPRDVDLAVLFGLGFPAERGGLLWWADTLGAERIVETLSTLSHLGPRAEPTPMLLDRARTGRRFYPPEAN